MLENETLWRQTPFGSASGINLESDVLVNVTADGVDVNQLWQEVQAVLASWNQERTSVTQLLTHQTINAADAVPQAIEDESFEEATEVGSPVSIRAPGNAVLLGNTLLDFDKAGRFSWKFLRDSTAEQIRAVTNYALAADNKLTNGLIMNRLFDPEPDYNEFNHTCYALWSGTDGMIPPPYLGKTFPANHSHYLVSEGDVIDSGDLDDSIKTITEHGYGVAANSQLIAFMNEQEADQVSRFRAGVQNNNDIIATHDFIPSQGAPPYYTPNEIVGKIAPAQYNGLKIDGSYGPLWIVRTQYIPAGYFATIATEGPNSPNNAVSVRQHTNATYQGLRTIPGPNPAYPIQESFWTRCIGVGTRHRGSAAVVQIKATGSYDVPQIPM
ncbi:hypothetical protein [Mycobacterium simiae]|uniref:Bacteriophage protein n=1 Tax=Mycobacterium simiae TaxID=1784 RepID=A0A1X0YFU3_MYCSI|nr:hypothetical protein [Mycobacterium simiae]ORJ63834.1 hypothetical protein B5M45_04665 [Mycobacterium simiae]